MNRLIGIKDILFIKVRERLNPVLGPIRRKSIINKKFTIISNNCWAGHVYRYFSLPYLTPTVGLYFFSEDYVRFLENLKEYLSMKLEFIQLEDSKYYEVLIERGGKDVSCPIGKLGDIEIVFLHYKTKEEAYEKWNRRVSRICWDNLFVKMSEQNNCSVDLMKRFEQLPYKKVLFTSKDYNFPSQVVYTEFLGKGQVLNDTTHFRRYINLPKWLNSNIVEK